MWFTKDNEEEIKNKEKEEKSDTFFASLVRETSGDEVAKGFKDFFGDWF